MTTRRTGVLFVHTATLPPLGADTWVHAQIIAALDRSTHDLHAACVTQTRTGPTPTFVALESIPELTLVPVDFGPELAIRSGVAAKLRALVQTLPAIVSLARLARHIRRHRIAIIHTSDRPRDAAASVLLARITRRPCIVHVHVAYNPAWMGRMLRWAIARADRIVAISEFVASTLVAHGHDPGSISVVPNAIDVDAWTPGRGRDEMRASLGVAESTTVVISVSRLFPEKGPAALIGALAIARPDIADVRLLIVGQEVQAGYRAELADLAVRLGVDDIVEFTGRRNDVAELMAAADVFAMPSFEEPFGLVFLEAMAMQLPVVALDNGGTPEVVADTRTGLLSAPGDTDALAANLRALIVDPDLRRRLGERGRRSVESAFTTSQLARNMAAVYELVAFSVWPTSSGNTSRRHTWRTR